MAGIFQRLFKTGQAEAHSLVDKLEDPIKISEQAIRDLKKDLQEIRPLIDTPLDFEKKLAEDFLPDYPELEMTEAFKSLHAGLINSWSILDKHGRYPYFKRALPI